jgi:phosphoribosylaminoimidazole-succinocarboxamide synthase
MDRQSESVQSAGVIYETHFPTLKLFKRGKVRDVYDLGEHFLIVATDRLSAYDVIMPQPIPLKGQVLTQLSNFWFSFTRDIVENHLVSTEVEEFPEECKPYRDQLRRRSIVVKKTRPLAIECVVRGYLSGSGWNEYKQHGTVCGIRLPDGLVESARLPEPLFTPATKAEIGHDENISFETASDIVGKEHAGTARIYALGIYNRAAAYAEKKGIIIADTKMEFGVYDGKLILIDEVLTPDSSRFWPRDAYRPGGVQESFDKQFVRDYLLSVNFNKKAPGPMLPREVIEKTSRLYCEALRLLVGQDLE